MEPIGRPLEAMEASYDVPYRSPPKNVTRVIFINGKIDMDINALRIALGRIAATYPILRMKIIDKLKTNSNVNPKEKNAKTLVFEEINEFRPELEVLDTNNWKKHLIEMSMKSFNTSIGPMWKVQKLKSVKDMETHKHTLILGFHHAICDGFSVKMFMHQLINELTLCSHSDSIITPPIINNELPPSYVEVLGEMLHRLRRVDPSMEATAPPAQSQLAILLFAPKPHIPEVIERKLITMEFDGTSNLIRQCREHDCKMQGMLMALADLALIQTLIELKPADAVLPDVLHVKRQFSQNLRNLGEKTMPPDAFGLYSSSTSMSRNVSSKVTELKQSFWFFAKSISDAVHESIVQQPASDFMRSEEYLYNGQPEIWRQEAAHPDPNKILREGIPYDYILVNTGTFIENEAEQIFEIDSAFSASYSHEGCLMNVAMSCGEKLCWSIAFETHVISEQRAGVFAANVKELLGMVAKGEGLS